MMTERVNCRYTRLRVFFKTVVDQSGATHCQPPFSAL